jgi:hypothetical protein
MFDPEAIFAYVAQLEMAITVAADEFREGDPGVGQRIIGVMAARIESAREAAEREAADQAARRHLH